MKRMLLVFGIIGLMGVLLGTAYAQEPIVKANVPFAFLAAGKALPAGNYEFRLDETNNTMLLRNLDTKKEVVVPVLAPLAGVTAAVKVTFDVVGDNHILETVWPSGADGYLIAVTKKKHTHKVIAPA